MVEKIEVKPTPIQRNQYDVAVELTKLYYSLHEIETPKVEEVQETYGKFYAVASAMSVKSNGYSVAEKIEKLLPELLKGK